MSVSKLTIIGSDNGLSPSRRQAIIWKNYRILLIGPLETNFSEILIVTSYVFVKENALENVVWKMAAILCRPQCVKWYASRIFVAHFSSAAEAITHSN